MADETATDVTEASPKEPAYREVKFRHSRDFVGLLDTLGVSLLVSTYQAGKLVTVGATAGKLNIRLHNFEQAMGMALHPRRLAVGSRGVIWMLQNAAELARRLEPPGTFDACYLARQSFITGNIHGHEMAWVGDELWVVNTLFSCLCTLHEDFSFVPRWQPPFITELAANDRCHLNGLAIEGGKPRYVTCMAESNEPGGWRPTKATSGRILDIASGEPVTQGMAMPHSPRVHGGRLWALNSGFGSLETVDLQSGKRDVVTTVPGYTRGLAFHEHFAFVGMSRIRETAVFGGVPIAEKRDELRCAVAVINLQSGQAVAFLEFETGVEEIFDVQVLPHTRNVSLTGPYPTQDDAPDVWVVPPPGNVPATTRVSGSTAALAPEQTLADDQVTELVRTGMSLHKQRKAAEAVNLFRRAAEARPKSPHIQNHLGNAWQDCGRQDLAEECYQRAIAVDERFAPAHQNLGYLWINFGRFDEGLSHLERAQQLQPADVNRVMLATSLPVVYRSLEDVRQRRARLESEVQKLVDEGLSLDTSTEIMPTNFFAAYQGFDDCRLQSNLGHIYRGIDLARQRRKTAEDRVRVGFLSAHFRDHTIGRLNLGRISLLNREKFEVTVISTGRYSDAMAQEFARVSDHYVQATGPIDVVRKQIGGLELDLLVFADVGMDAMTYTLSFSRMAEVQCATWGHPVTTGSPTMDYFLSSEALENEDADAHYTERLVRMANLGTYYYRPHRLNAPRSRESFGLDSSKHFYFCPQTLFKIHPEFDDILAGILKRDPLGEIVLIEGRQPTWTRLIRERFEKSMGKLASRVRFLPAQPNAEFLELNALADVLLDPIHFGGGNTSYEGLALATPIVTWPGEFLRSRITLALYQKMGFADCVVRSADAYIDLATRLGMDKDLRRATSDRIRDRSSILFDDPAEVREFEQALAMAHESGRPTPKQPQRARR